MKGDFIPPPPIIEQDEPSDALPDQEEFWRPPVRFGSIPVEKEPLGWDRRRGYRKLFPRVSLPFQIVDRVRFGHPELEPNRLIWGDNLHVMRQLPGESVDLIYIDPPFFSGRNYNVIFGDRNELRSFSDIWEGGMPGYLIWLNARLYEMKRLLKTTGSIYVHCDWHASHYIKVEMDKIFGFQNFRNEIIWWYHMGAKSRREFSRKHDILLRYSKGSNPKFDIDRVRMPFKASSADNNFYFVDEEGRRYREKPSKTGKRYRYYLDEGSLPEDVWEIPTIPALSAERIGYPTQKPIELLQRIIDSSSAPGDTIADFFAGGGSFVEAAMGVRVERDTDTSHRKVYRPEEARRWIACDQSRVAVAITADRIAGSTEQLMLGNGAAASPDFTIEHWGVYEARRLAETPTDQFRQFVLRAFGAVPEEHEEGFHGMKGAVPVWVGEADPKKAVTAREVQDFANAIRKTLRYRQDNLRDGIMLAWAFRPDALEAAERLHRLALTDLNFIKLEQIRIDSPLFREHVAALSTEDADYQTFLTFVQAPRVEVGYKRVARHTYMFDVSDTIISNAGAKIINVQWDFDYRERFTSTRGFSFVRSGSKEPAVQVQYEFPSAGRKNIACRVQDDIGGEGMWATEIDVN